MFLRKIILLSIINITFTTPPDKFSKKCLTNSEKNYMLVKI